MKVNATESAFIRRLRKLTPLDDLQIGAVADLMVDEQKFAAERHLFSEGDQPEWTHILLDGWAARVKLLPDGRRHFAAILVAGDICDVDGLLVRRYDYGVMALTPCSVARVNRQALLALCDAHPAIARAFTWLTFVDNAIINEASVSLARRTAAQRLAHFFCELVQRLDFIDRAQPTGFNCPLSQEKLADALGLTGVHVNRTLRELRTSGLAALSGGAVRLLDPAGLRRLANFSPAYLHLEGMRSTPL